MRAYMYVIVKLLLMNCIFLCCKISPLSENHCNIYGMYDSIAVRSDLRLKYFYCNLKVIEYYIWTQRNVVQGGIA